MPDLILTRSEPTIPLVKCEAAGIYCGHLGILERENAGKAGLCCRHYLTDPPVIAIYDALYSEEEGVLGGT